MAKAEPKKPLSAEEMRIKAEETIRFYKNGRRYVNDLYSFVDSLIKIHNEACRSGDEMTWMTTFQASYPDH